MALRVAEHRIIYRDPQYYCGPGPSVVIDSSGRLTLALRRVRSWLGSGHWGHWHPATESCLLHSEDGGRTWSEPAVFLAGYQCPCLTRLADGTLLHSTHRMELVPAAIAAQCSAEFGVRADPWPGIHAGTAVWRSWDDGRSWGQPAYLGGVPGVEPLLAELPAPLAVRGNILETAAGPLLVSAYDLTSPNNSHLFRSEDGGGNWHYVGPIGAGFNETFLYETAAGDVLALMRAWDGAAPFVHQARSSDGGDTWSAAAPLCDGYPACAVGLPNGLILLAYGYRFAGQYGVRARLLSAAGELLGEEECVIQDDGAAADLGYPEAVVLPDGRALVVYYTNDKREGAAGPRFIAGCVLEVD